MNHRGLAIHITKMESSQTIKVFFIHTMNMIRKLVGILVMMKKKIRSSKLMEMNCLIKAMYKIQRVK